MSSTEMLPKINGVGEGMEGVSPELKSKVRRMSDDIVLASRAR